MFTLFILILSFIYSTTYFSHVKFILKHYIFYKYFDKYILSMVFEGYILNLCMPKFIYSVCYYWSVCKEIKRSVLKEIRPEYSWKDWCWSWTSITLTTWCKELTHWKRPWCLERLKAGREGDNRGWDGSMASQIRRTWVWESSGSWWWTVKPDLLQSIGSQRVGHD